MKPTIFEELKDLIRNPLPKYQFKTVDTPVRTPREEVMERLNSIGASAEEKDEVIGQCENDKEFRQFYLDKARGKI